MTETFDNKIESGACAILYLNEEFADVNFVFKDEGKIVKVPANKAILAALSPVFRAMFFGPIKETGDVKIVDATADGFKDFLQFFYLDQVLLTIEKIDEVVVQLADKYDMIQYINNCIKLLAQNLTPRNVCFAYQLSISTNNVNLRNLCEEKISIYTSSVFASDSFVRCNQTVLKHILEMEFLQCDESNVFHACLDWAKFACKRNNLDENQGENKREMLGECLYLIRFNAMKTEEFAHYAQMHETLFTPEELVEIFFVTTTGKCKSNKFKSNPRSTINWSKDRKILCVRKKPDSAMVYNVQNVESIWFSSNNLVLLGELTLQRFACNEKLVHNLSIIELQKHSFDANKAGKIIHSAHVDLRREKTELNRMCKNFIQSEILFLNLTLNHSRFTHLLPAHSLTHPIVINPRNMYEIRMENLSNINCSHHNQLEFNVALEHSLVIEFHQHPLQKVNGDRRGLVFELFFSAIPNF